MIKDSIGIKLKNTHINNGKEAEIPYDIYKFRDEDGGIKIKILGILYRNVNKPSKWAELPNR